MKPEEMSAVQERRFRKSVDYFRKNREIYVRRIKKIFEESKNSSQSNGNRSDSEENEMKACFDSLDIGGSVNRSIPGIPPGVPPPIYAMSHTQQPAFQGLYAGQNVLQQALHQSPMNHSLMPNCVPLSWPFMGYSPNNQFQSLDHPGHQCDEATISQISKSAAMAQNSPGMSFLPPAMMQPVPTVVPSPYPQQFGFPAPTGVSYDLNMSYLSQLSALCGCPDCATELSAKQNPYPDVYSSGGSNSAREDQNDRKNNSKNVSHNFPKYPSADSADLNNFDSSRFYLSSSETTSSAKVGIYSSNNSSSGKTEAEYGNYTDNDDSFSQNSKANAKPDSYLTGLGFPNNAAFSPFQPVSHSSRFSGGGDCLDFTGGAATFPPSAMMNLSGAIGTCPDFLGGTYLNWSGGDPSCSMSSVLSSQSSAQTSSGQNSGNIRNSSPY